MLIAGNEVFAITFDCALYLDSIFQIRGKARGDCFFYSVFCYRINFAKTADVVYQLATFSGGVFFSEYIECFCQEFNCVRICVIWTE